MAVLRHPLLMLPLLLLVLACWVPAPSVSQDLNNQQRHQSVIRSTTTMPFDTCSDRESGLQLVRLAPKPADSRRTKLGSSDGVDGGDLLLLDLRRSADGSFVGGAVSRLALLEGNRGALVWQVNEWHTQLTGAKLTFAVFWSEAEFLAVVRSTRGCDVRAALRSRPPAAYLGTDADLSNASVPILSTSAGSYRGRSAAAGGAGIGRSIPCVPSEMFLLALASDPEHDDHFAAPGDIYAATHWVAAGDPLNIVCPNALYDWGYVRIGVVQCPCSGREALLPLSSTTATARRTLRPPRHHRHDVGRQVV